MVKITKRPLPDGVTISSDNDYRSGPVFDILVNDCRNKCYICEDKPTGINVEHIVHHNSDPALRYNWDNLFLACVHCNSIKGTKYDDILNPAQIDPEDRVALAVEISDDFTECVTVTPLRQEPATLKTTELLHLVYNGGSTPIKKLEAANLRNEHLLPDIKLFEKYIHDYINEHDLGYDVIIEKEISRSSKFAAFKRKIIRDDPQLSVTFAEALSNIS